MAGLLDVKITYTPRLTQAEQQLAALPSRLRNLGAVMTQGIAPLATAMLSQHWESEGAAFGHPWAPWRPATLAARLRKGNAAKGLEHDTDQLFHALFDSLANGQRVQQTASGVRLDLGSAGISDPVEAMKFRFQQKGTNRMVARQLVPNPLPRSFRDQVRQVVHDYIATGRIRGEGGQFVAFNGATQ